MLHRRLKFEQHGKTPVLLAIEMGVKKNRRCARGITRTNAVL
jgi:hypothetical protein